MKRGHTAARLSGSSAAAVLASACCPRGPSVLKGGKIWHSLGTQTSCVWGPSSRSKLKVGWGWAGAQPWVLQALRAAYCLLLLLLQHAQRAMLHLTPSP